MTASPKSQTDAKEIVSEKNMRMGIRNSGLRPKRKLLKKGDGTICITNEYKQIDTESIIDHCYHLGTNKTQSY